ncbi:hypothetical protein [Embleya scabrispora]|nr:hypothetical protein [Embleya scabrispora]
MPGTGPGGIGPFGRWSDPEDDLDRDDDIDADEQPSAGDPG